MDPELQKLWESVQAAQGRGVPRGEIDAALRSNGIRNVPTLLTLMQGGQPTDLISRFDAPTERESAQARISERAASPVSDFARMLGQGATLGGGDEIAGAVAGLGAMVPGGRSPKEAYQETQQASQQRVEDLRTVAPGTSALTEVAGGVLGPMAAAKGAGVTARGILGAAPRGTQAQQGAQLANQYRAATAGVRPAASQAAREVLRAGAGTGAVGAAYGGAQGLLEADPGERLEGASTGAQIGGLLGAGLGMVPAAPVALLNALRRRGVFRETRNARIAGQAEGTLLASGRHADRGAVREATDEAKKTVQQEFKRMEGEGGFSNHALRTVLNQPVVRAQPLHETFRELGDPNVLRRALSDNTTLRYEDIQVLRQGLQQRTEEAFRAGKNPLAYKLADARFAFDEAVESMFGDKAARTAWRELSMVPDAMDLGGQVARQSVTAVREAAEQFASHPEARAAFQVGALRTIFDDIATRGGKVAPNKAFQDKLAVFVPDEAVRNDIYGIMAREGRQAGLERAVDFGIKALGFLGGSTSLFGAGILAAGS